MKILDEKAYKAVELLKLPTTLSFEQFITRLKVKFESALVVIISYGYDHVIKNQAKILKDVIQKVVLLRRNCKLQAKSE